jgi:predicted ATP-binding protein involved in virulence
MSNGESYEQVISKLEDVPEEKESDYMSAIYNSLQRMHQFTTEEVSQNTDSEDMFEPDSMENPQHYDAIEDKILYEIFIDTLEKSYGLKDFVKNVKRMKEFEDGHNYELRQELINDALDDAQGIKENLNFRPEEMAENVLEATEEVTSDIFNNYEKIVESVIGPAIDEVE